MAKFQIGNPGGPGSKGPRIVREAKEAMEQFGWKRVAELAKTSSPRVALGYFVLLCKYGYVTPGGQDSFDPAAPGTNNLYALVLQIMQRAGTEASKTLGTMEAISAEVPISKAEDCNHQFHPDTGKCIKCPAVTGKLKEEGGDL